MNHIKKFESHKEIDPFGEESWGDSKPKFEIGEMVRSNSNYFHYGLNSKVYTGLYYYITNYMVNIENNLFVSVLEVSSGKKIDGWYDQSAFDKI